MHTSEPSRGYSRAVDHAIAILFLAVTCGVAVATVLVVCKIGTPGGLASVPRATAQAVVRD